MGKSTNCDAFYHVNLFVPLGTSSLLGVDIFLSDIFIGYGNERTKLQT